MLLETPASLYHSEPHHLPRRILVSLPFSKSRVTNHARFLKAYTVLALKVLYAWQPLCPGQTRVADHPKTSLTSPSPKPQGGGIQGNSSQQYQADPGSPAYLLYMRWLYCISKICDGQSPNHAVFSPLCLSPIWCPFKDYDTGLIQI